MYQNRSILAQSASACLDVQVLHVDSRLSGILLPMSVNKAILVGRLGRDPETRFTSGGQAVANFTLATDETFKDRAGERQKRTEWHRWCYGGNWRRSRSSI